MIKELWSKRLSLLQKDDDILSRCLNTHSLVLSPSENVRDMVEYARILRKAGRKELAFKVQSSVCSVSDGDLLLLNKIVRAYRASLANLTGFCSAGWRVGRSDLGAMSTGL